MYRGLKEPMQLRHVKSVAKDLGMKLDGIKIRIDRNTDLLGRGLYGHTDGKTITLYPDAFTDIENLVKTLGHERMHVYQVSIFGRPKTMKVLKMFEDAAVRAEKDWWNYYKLVKGIKK